MTYRPQKIPQLFRQFATSTKISPKEARENITRDRFLRVDHAGEVGADRIYAGQMAVLGKSNVGSVIQHMWDQEKEHRKKFDELLPKYRARPTVMLPIWNVAGFALGAGSALLGPKMAMACTAAVETVITDHYNDQIRELMTNPEENGELLKVISKFRDEEMEHHDTAILHKAEEAPLYQVFAQAVKIGCKGAIWISERI
ncbi:5-demethoxyubiquinone hydroxylase, mitochondrial-like [Daphnia pulex]|uniref:5-demethoxyubiquinone hydroxylase, mitochondrial-like n=1 Tax=Daphnia pulex TaxID=6669 RepID=UPI001EDFB0F9|nr:5-demethoxyubiquinone hydroxylase, mitochondrial-like [Daphnia pulex]XP_046444505.1 5-demethoxyubiquinone hydroxylase, mitochondrial-like [Daphnia pulex]